MRDVLMGFDPGGSTGYCVAHLDDNDVLGFKVVRCNVIAWNDRIPAIRALLKHYMPQTIITEDFMLYKSKAKDMVGKRMQSSEVIGIIQTYLYEFSLPDTYLRLAATIARTEIPKAHLHYIPNVTAEQKEHCMDAYKHIRHHIVMLKSQRVAAAAKAVQKQKASRK